MPGEQSKLRLRELPEELDLGSSRARKLEGIGPAGPRWT